jgi:hypothetical protein
MRAVSRQFSWATLGRHQYSHSSERTLTMRNRTPRELWMVLLLAILALAVVRLPEAQAQAKNPNILVIFGDDVGFGISAPITAA